MKSKITREQTEQEIKNIFSNNPFPKQIKKAKTLAMSKNIKLGSLRKKFCKKCFNFFTPNNSEIRIKKPYKMVRCRNCKYISKYKLS